MIRIIDAISARAAAPDRRGVACAPASRPLVARTARPRAPGCDLCEAARLTRWHHEDDVCWIADCELCDVPMAVWRSHGTEPPDDELAHMLAQLSRAARDVFREFHVDTVRRNIPGHWHAHARPKGRAALAWWLRRRA